jgi:peptide/nickel transport system ATP-binding protein/oligopeptide transport system ATP-binding protein
MRTPLLDIRDLSVTFATDEGRITAVDNISFSLEPGEVLGLVGESGCGKSVTALSILRLIPIPPGRIEAGGILFRGRDLSRTDSAAMRAVRGNEIGMIFQEPTSALSPLHRVGAQLVEAIRLHRPVDDKTAWKEGESWLSKVGIPDAAERMYAYPFQLSGGMQQRVMIAMTLMMNPAVVIADEPTTALDVTIQAQLFDLIREMKGRQTAILLITHDMGVVWEMCDRVAVMYASRIAETGPREALFANPAHPYTKGLLQSIPSLSDALTKTAEERRARRLTAIQGQVPPPMHYPPGCHFQDRCPHVMGRCRREIPPLFEIGDNRRSACFLAE